jgi:hypothetical protein
MAYVFCLVGRLVAMTHSQENHLTLLGFAQHGVISSRSAMLPELDALLALVPAPAEVAAEVYRRLAVEEDALQKLSVANRQKTFNYLKRLYGLDPALALFRDLARLWPMDAPGRPMLAALLAFAREPLLHKCLAMVASHPPGSALGRADFEQWVRDVAPGQYSATMYRSFSHNLYASFFQFGYLGAASGKSRLRQTPTVTAAVTAYAAFLDWLEGRNGMTLLGSRYSAALQLTTATHIDLLTSAGRQNLMRVAYSGGVLELDFSTWLKPGEQRLLA